MNSDGFCLSDMAEVLVGERSWEKGKGLQARSPSARAQKTSIAGRLLMGMPFHPAAADAPAVSRHSHEVEAGVQG